MIIHVPIKGAFKEERTGVENYIRELLEKWSKKDFEELKFVLYYRGEPDDDVLWQRLQSNDSFILKKVSLPYLWTQAGLSYELAKSRYTNSTNRTNKHEIEQKNTSSKRQKGQDSSCGSVKLRDQVPQSSVLFVPAHVLPIYCGVPAVVTIHGLEYEHYPEHYPFWHRLYLKWMTRLSCFRAKKIVAVSEATKKDLMRFYDVPKDKIDVVPHGVQTLMDTDERAEKIQPSLISTDGETKLVDENYILYLGRVELKKNVLNMIKAFKALKSAEQRRRTNTERGRGTNAEKGESSAMFSDVGSAMFSASGSARFSDLKLVLAGGKGYGYSRINDKLQISNYKEDIIELGYVSQVEKWRLLENAKVFCFATYYEGFGMPILEAQRVGTPVVVGSEGAGPQVGSDAVLKADPNEPKEIAGAIGIILEDDDLREELVEKGYANVERFSWDKCAKETLEVITGTY